ncbi:MAG: methyltransferase domain-containing protein [bacterium]|nr:methyltransferase domain-containing protein [bacterium]
MDVRAYNREAWDRCVVENDRWTRPVSAEEVAAARRGAFEIVLTPTKRVPRDWFPELPGMKTLCLASAGGQQAPLLAAAGAVVTVFDNSPKQLGQDRLVAERDGLTLELIEGDMADLSRFADESFGLIFHPCSNCFVPNILPVWKECFRVLKPGGILLSGVTNPVRHIFDDEKMENGSLEVRNTLPYSDLDHLDDSYIQNVLAAGEPLAFGHTLEDQIGGQLNAGFVLTGFYEDRYAESDNDVLSRYMPSFIATRALKR